MGSSDDQGPRPGASPRGPGKRASRIEPEAALAVGERVIDMEIRGLEALRSGLDAAFVAAIDAILAMSGRLIVVGVGKSGHVARKIAATFASTGTPAHFVHPSEASHGDLGIVDVEDVVLALSNSGETRELSDIVAYCNRFDILLMAITRNATSMLGRAAQVVLQLPAADEACAETRAPTTSTTMQMALGDALAVSVLEARGFRAADFRRFHPGGSLGAALSRVSDIMHPLDATPLVAAGSLMADALIEMTSKGFGCVGVVNEAGDLIGVVTDGDLRRSMGDGLLARSVDEVMTRDPLTVRPDTLAGETLALMTQGKRRVTVVFVVADEKTQGIVHLHDLTRIGVA